MAEPYENSMTDSYSEKVKIAIHKLHDDVLAGLKAFGEYRYRVDIHLEGHDPATMSLSRTVPLYAPEVVKDYQGPTLQMNKKADSFAKDMMNLLLDKSNFGSGDYRVLVVIHTPNRPIASSNVRVTVPAKAAKEMEDALFSFNEYQESSQATAIYPEIGHCATYPILGLVNEAGEVAGTFKKVFRDKDGKIDADTMLKLISELGDVFWYWTQVCTELNLSIAEVAQSNLDKLQSRKERGVLKGDGDDR